MHNLVINIAFLVLLLIMIYLNYNQLLTNILDVNISLLGILISLLLLFFENTKIIDIAHFLYCVVYLFTVAFFSSNKFLLSLNVLMIAAIIFSRYYFKECILNKKQNNKGFFVDLNDFVKKYIKILDWNYIFPILMIVSLIRFIEIKDITDTIVEAN